MVTVSLWTGVSDVLVSGLSLGVDRSPRRLNKVCLSSWSFPDLLRLLLVLSELRVLLNGPDRKSSI